MPEMNFTPKSLSKRVDKEEEPDHESVPLDSVCQFCLAEFKVEGHRDWCPSKEGIN